jgi:PAS domain S-box-containing protein
VITLDPENQKLKDLLCEKDKQVEIEIEKRKVAEKELNINKQRYKQVLQKIPVIILATDTDGSIIFYNREFERASGYTQSDMVNNPELLELLLPNVSEDPNSKLENKNEWAFIHKDGTKKVVVWSNLSEYCPIPGWESWKVGIDITPLKEAQEKIKILRGSLPICASCKKIRDDEGAWNQIEIYISDRSEAKFSHGICPECAEELYPEVAHNFK